MKEYTFTIQYQDYIATVALTGDYSLYEFANIITDTVGFDFDHPFEFCNNLKNPYKSTERYSVFADMDEPSEDETPDPGVENTPVATAFEKGKTMLFHFDYGDDWFFLIRCTAIAETDKKSRSKKVIATKGTPPEQYPDYDDEDEDFEEEDSEDEEPDNK